MIPLLIALFLLLAMPVGALEYLAICALVDLYDETVWNWKHRNNPPYELREPPNHK